MKRRYSNGVVVAIALAMAMHGVGLVVAEKSGFADWLFESGTGEMGPIQLVILDPSERSEDDEDDPEDEPDDEFDGQIVEVAPPVEEERPKEADYLAEADNTVEEETRSERFEVNPEILAAEYSRDQKLEAEDLQDLNVTEPSTGAVVGNDRFDPDRDGRMAALPSPWVLTNKEGAQAPVPASHAAAMLAGAPSNDLLDEKRANQTALNTKEFLYASYLNRIRRLVNFYWSQNLDNLPNSVTLAKPRYTTTIEAVLDGNGALETLVVTDESGSPELDDAVVRAFQIAGPYPNPPEGLLEKDGRAYLPRMGFTVTLGKAENQFQGVDPRAGVQFPGLLKGPY